MALGKNIAAFRSRRGWDRGQLASKASERWKEPIDPKSIWALESRDSKTSEFVGAIAAAFGVTIEQLIAGDDNPGADPVADFELVGNLGYIGIAVIAAAALSLLGEYTLPATGCLVLGAIVGGIFGAAAGWIAAGALAFWFWSARRSS